MVHYLYIQPQTVTMKKILLLLFPAFLTGFLNAQVIFEDSFNDNKNNWEVGKTATAKMKIKSNLDQYHLSHLRKIRILATTIEVKFSEAKDFKIEALLYKKGGTNHSGYGLIWGGKDHENFYSLLVTGDGGWLFGKVEEGKWQDITNNWQDHSAVQEGKKAYNKMTVVKKGNQYTFSINDREVAKVPFYPFYGHHIGFNVNRKQRIMVEYLKVEYL